MNETARNFDFPGAFSENRPRLFAAPVLRALVVALCVAAAGCAPKSIDRKPMQETPGAGGFEEPAMDEGEAEAYPSHVAGTVTELYGESGEAEQSQAYRDAVEENPMLRYIIVYFDFNEAEVRPESREVLLEHAGYLSEHPEVEVSLEGHADKRGSSGYNLALGERRALAVKNFLLAHGVQEFQGSVISYGEERPVNTDNNEQAYAKNRRVELIYR